MAEPMPLRRFALLIALAALLPLLHGCLAFLAGGAAAGADAAHDRRSFATVVDDRNIQLTAFDALNHDKELALKNNVKIVVYNGTMLLCGQVRSEELKQRAQAIVERVDGIQRMVNELDVVDVPEGFWRRRADNALTARVKTALLDITSMPGFDPTRVNVTTAHRNVYLMGLLSHEEAAAVTAIARDIGGVEKVVKVFEYTD